MREKKKRERKSLVKIFFSRCSACKGPDVGWSGLLPGTGEGPGGDRWRVAVQGRAQLTVGDEAEEERAGRCPCLEYQAEVFRTLRWSVGSHGRTYMENRPSSSSGLGTKIRNDDILHSITTFCSSRIPSH